MSYLCFQSASSLQSRPQRGHLSYAPRTLDYRQPLEVCQECPRIIELTGEANHRQKDLLLPNIYETRFLHYLPQVLQADS